MRVYIHYELTEPEFTLPVTLEAGDSRTVSDLKTQFLAAYATKHGVELDAGAFVLANTKKRPMPASQRVMEITKPNDDVFLVASKGKAQTPERGTTPASSSASSSVASSVASLTKALPGSTTLTEKKSSPQSSQSSSSSHTGQTPAPTLQAGATRSPLAGNAGPSGNTGPSGNAAPSGNSGPAGKSAAVAEFPAKAKWVRPVLADEPKNPQVEAWLEQSLGVARDLKAKGSLRQACSAWKQILAVAPGRVECSEGLAETAMAAGRHQEAIDLWCQAVAHVTTPAPQLMVNIGKASHEMGDHPSALVFFNRAMEARLLIKESDECDDIKVLIGKALYASGNQDAAIQLYTNVLQREEGNVAALLEYAQAYVDRGRAAEALKILLRILVLESSSKVARGAISKIVQAPGGLAILYSELGEAAKSGAALAFMATLIKDYGATEESCALYYKAMEASPEMTTYALNLVHTLEVQDRYEEALDVALGFMRSFPDMAVGTHYTNRQVLERIGDCKDLRSDKHRVASLPDAHPGCNRTVRWIPNYGAVVEDKPEDGKPSEVAGSTALPSPAAAPPAKGEQRLPPYTADELDLQALHFTICKILYAVGALALIPGVVEVIEPARRGFDMHLTTIRNEHAYYCCVTQLFLSLPSPFPSSKEVIYCCGDSHSLSSAWQVITVKGKETVLVPKLVTGLKCYHLRSESVFFPKNNFNNVVASIPRGARVLFMFGEIDCREGILRAVEKTRYTDIEEGLRVTIDFYLSSLDALVKKQGLDVYVQPVAPVLNETREVVKAFNTQLKESVARSPNLTFLDIMDQLLTPDGTNLQPDFEMDGTHMGPKYVRVLEGAFNKL